MPCPLQMIAKQAKKHSISSTSLNIQKKKKKKKKKNCKRMINFPLITGPRRFFWFSRKKGPSVIKCRDWHRTPSVFFALLLWFQLQWGQRHVWARFGLRRQWLPASRAKWDTEYYFQGEVPSGLLKARGDVCQYALTRLRLGPLFTSLARFLTKNWWDAEIQCWVLDQPTGVNGAAFAQSQTHKTNHHHQF